MLDDILFLDRGIQIAPLRRPHGPLLTLFPLRTRPPTRQDPAPRLGQVQKLPKIQQRIVSVVESAGIAGEVVVVLDAHAVAVDELAESVLFGEVVEVVARADLLEEVGDYFGHGVGVECGLMGFLGIGLLWRGTDCLVGFPVGLLAITVAVPLIHTFGAAFERNVCLTFVAFAANLRSRIHGREKSSIDESERLRDCRAE